MVEMVPMNSLEKENERLRLNPDPWWGADIINLVDGEAYGKKCFINQNYSVVTINTFMLYYKYIGLKRSRLKL